MDTQVRDAVDRLVEASVGAAVILESLAGEGAEGDALRLVARALEERAAELAGAVSA